MSEIESVERTEAQLQYAAREKRFNDAVSLTKPDRVPIACEVAFFVPRYAEITAAEAMYDYEKMSAAWKWAAERLNLDLMSPPDSNMLPGPVMEMLGLKSFKWPGHNLKENLCFQYVEGEYMKADEYDELLRDPADFTIRKLMPRNASTLEPLGMLPPVHWFSSGYSILKLLPIFCGLPPFAQLLEKLHRIGEEMNKWNAAHARLSQDLTEMGCPPLYGAKTVVPFDWISDMLRGMRGSMLDMYRQPDKLKAAIELFTPFTIESAIMAARQLNNPRVVIPLHRGAAGFMSNQQFAEFYWPSLKSMCLSFIDAGLVPMPIFEGDYTPRLEFLAELPKGKVLGHFDVVDRKKARQMIGDTMCFWGNVPSSLLITGRPEQVRDDVKELIDTFADNGGLIIEGSAGIPDEAKPENVEAMIETVFEYGVNR